MARSDVLDALKNRLAGNNEPPCGILIEVDGLDKRDLADAVDEAVSDYDLLLILEDKGLLYTGQVQVVQYNIGDGWGVGDD